MKTTPTNILLLSIIIHSDEQRSVCGVSVWLCAHSYSHHTPPKSKLISNDQ
jgi:hypothetical protein